MARSKKNGVELATAYVSVTTDTSNISDELAEGLDDAVKKVGPEAGEKLGDELGKGAADGVEKNLSKSELGPKLQKGGLAIGAVAGGAIALGLKDAMSQADLGGSLAAQMGLDLETAKDVAADARAIFNDGWGEDLESVGKLYADTLNQSGLAGDLNADLQGLTTQAIALSNEFGDESQKIIESAAQLVKNGLAPTMQDAMDTITRGYQTSSQMSEDWLDTITEYSTIFRELGLDAGLSAGLISQGLNAGARNGDQVADALKEFSIRGKDMEKGSIEAFDALGLSATDMAQAIAGGGEEATAALTTTLNALRGVEDPVKRNSIAVGLFGTKAEDLGQALYALDPSKLTDIDISGTAAKFAEDSKSFDQAIAGITRSLTYALGAALQPLLPMMQTFADLLVGALGWLVENPVITTVLIAIASAIGVVAAAQWVWNAAQLANPATWILIGIVAAIGLVVAGVLWLVANWETATTAIGEMIQTIIDKVSELLGWFGQVLGFNASIDVNNGGGSGKKPAPGAANGGTVNTGGRVRVGEFGPEELVLPSAARIEPLPDDGGRSVAQAGATYIFNNPVAERGSDSLRKQRNTIAASAAL